MSILERTVSIHGVPVRVRAEGEAVAAAVTLLLEGFEPDGSASGATLDLRYHSVPARESIPITVPEGADVLLSQRIAADGRCGGWECTVRRAGRRLFVDFGPRGLTLVDHAEGRVEAFVVAERPARIEELESLARFGLTEILRSRDLFSLHAAAADADGRGVLLIGSSGRGKTTSVLSLLRAGYRLLSDDHPLLRETAGGVEVLSFPTKIDVTDETVALIPEVREAAASLRPGGRKRWFRVGEIFPDREARRTCPRLLLFPEVIDWPKSRLDPLPRSRALEEILRQGLVVLDREIAVRHMATFSRLVRETACYRLRLGEDFLDLPAQIDRLLGEAS